MAAEPDYSDLSAVFVNCTLKRSPEVSNTQGLMDAGIRFMREHGVAVDTLRLVDHDVATGVHPDMREYGWQFDAWPEEIWPKVEAADAGWTGEAGPGPSYLDEGSGGPENDFTNRNTTFMTYNLMHLAHLLRQAGGIPAVGNVRSEWDSGEHFGYVPNPEHPDPEYR